MRLFFKPFGHVAANDALRQTLDDGRLADARIADQHRIVFGAARQDLNDAADLFVAADHRIELAAFGLERQVAAVALERLVGAFGIFGRDALVAAHLAQRLQQLVFGQTCVAKEAADFAGRLRHRQQHVLHRRVVVLQRFGFVLGHAHDARQLGRKRDLRRVGTAAAQTRELADGLLGTLRDRFRIGTRRCENVGRDAALLVEQRGQHMLGSRLRVVFVERARIGRVEPVGNALGHLIYVHFSTTIDSRDACLVAGLSC